MAGEQAAAKATHEGGSAVGKLLSATTAGLPNWAWLLIIGSGIAIAVIVPKLFGGGTSTDQTSTDQTAGTDQTGTIGTDLSGAYPYGQGVGGGGGGGPIGSTSGQPLIGDYTQGYGPVSAAPTTTSQPTSATAETERQAASTSAQAQLHTQHRLQPQPTHKPAHPNERYITVQRWPEELSTLSGIGSRYGVSVERLRQLNPGIKNPNLIYPNQRIRVA